MNTLTKEKMWVARLLEPRKIKLEENAKPEPGKNEAIISVTMCGICGSDANAYLYRANFATYPVVQGHEFVGVIEKIGSNVEKLKEGDKITVNPALSCRKCSFCGEGKYNICTNLKFLGDQLDGAFAEYIKVPVDRIIPLSSDMTFVQSALIEPTAMAVHAVNRANVKLGTKVVVIGAGPIGLLICQMAMVLGASEMIVADKRESQINLAKSLGAKHVVNVSEAHLKEKVNEITGGEGVDLVFECAGAKESIAEALRIVKNGGDVVMVSLPAKDLTLPIVQISLKEVNLVGVGVYLQREIITAINLIRKRKIKVEPLVTHIFDLREIRQAFELAASRKEGVCKVIIKIGEAGL